jgi:hypothetical protein
VSANRRQWGLYGLAIAIVSLQEVAQASAQTRPNNPPMMRTPNLVHPGRFVGPDSVRFPSPPAPATVLDMESGTEMPMRQGRASRKQAGRSK